MKIALGITGCIAAYKSVELMRGLQKAGVDVQVILTRSARRFIAPLTLEALSTLPVIESMFRAGDNREIQHIRLAQEVRLLAVAPATANILGKFAHGVADDFLSTFYLSCPAPVLLAPAMNVVMWRHPAVQANVRTLEERGHAFVYPEEGSLACGMEGRGRLADVGAIVAEILGMLGRTDAWKGLRVLITAGPTIEDIDPVRYLSNRSSGKMGYALARAAANRGADVFLVSGPTQLQTPAGVRAIRVRSAAQMRDATLELYPQSDVVVKAAAVADYRPASVSARKMKKSPSSASIPLVPTDDILAHLGREKSRQILVGFAAETEDLLPNARRKMQSKNLDMVVANDVSRGVFGEDRASVLILTREGEEIAVENEAKPAIAERVLDLVEKLRRPGKTAPDTTPGSGH